MRAHPGICSPLGLKYNLATSCWLALEPTGAACTVRDHLVLRLKRVRACSLSASRSAVTVQAASAAALTFAAAQVGQSARRHGVLTCRWEASPASSSTRL